MDKYRTIKTKSESLFKDKGSKHFGYVYPVASEEQAKEHLDKLRKENHNANHVCYAFRLGADKQLYRFSDDGEPSNSAGKPIMGQIESFDLTNVLIAVVRYFGGTKLGVGGLINAYRTAAKMAVEGGQIIEQIVKEEYLISFNYDAMNTIMKIVKEHQLDILKQQFDLNCELQVAIKKSEIDKIVDRLNLLKGVDVKHLKTN